MSFWDMYVNFCIIFHVFHCDQNFACQENLCITIFNCASNAFGFEGNIVLHIPTTNGTNLLMHNVICFAYINTRQDFWYVCEMWTIFYAHKMVHAKIVLCIYDQIIDLSDMILVHMFIYVAWFRSSCIVVHGQSICVVHILCILYLH